MKATIPVVYEDTPMRVLPGDDHNPPLLIQDTENVTFDLEMRGSRPYFKITLPKGRESVILGKDDIERAMQVALNGY